MLNAHPSTKEDSNCKDAKICTDRILFLSLQSENHTLIILENAPSHTLTSLYQSALTLSARMRLQDFLLT